MCSLVEGEMEEEELMLVAEGQEMLCKKCRLSTSVVRLRVRDTYCQSCFLSAVHHNFRATLGKHKAMKPGERVCVAYSGGVASSSMLHLLKSGLETDVKRLLFVPVVLHVDTGSLQGLTAAQRRDNIRQLVAETSDYGFPVYTVLLEDALLTSGELPVYAESELDTLHFNPELQSKIRLCVENVRENSGKEDLIANTLHRALISGALWLDCGKIFSAADSTALAVELVAGVAAGRGSNLAHSTGFRDLRHSGVTLLRPLREISSKEIALYAQFHHIPHRTVTTLSTGAERLFSIRRLTEDFLTGLQEDFPATLSTVFRTGDKLQVEHLDNEAEICSLCSSGLDTAGGQLCALSATAWSQLVSSRGPVGVDAERLMTKPDPVNGSSSQSRGCSDEGGACCRDPEGRCCEGLPSREEVMSTLCYACRKVLSSIRSVEDLPPLVIVEAARHRTRRRMEDTIKGFLL